MNNLIAKKTSAVDVVATDVETMEVKTDAGPFARVGWMIVIFGVCGFLIWATTAPLDQGVPLSGTVSVASSRKVIQHQSGGTIDEILVKDGESVKEGQVLVKMNNVMVKSNVEIAEAQWYTDLATEARLSAERDGASNIIFSKELKDVKKNLHVANSMQLQQQLFNTRKNSINSEMGAYEENIAGLTLQLKGVESSMLNKKQQQALLKEQVESLNELSKDGYVPRNRVLDVERAYAQINGEIYESIGNVGRLKSQLSEVALRKSQRLQDYQKEVRTQLAEVQKSTEGLAQKVKALNFELSNTLVRAPLDGVIVGMNVFTNGGVVQSGFKLMELVPTEDALIVDGMLAVQLVDKVHAGLPVDFIFSAFNTNTTPHIPGVITQVSADRSIDERTGQPYYKVKAEVTPKGKKMLRDAQVKAGMPVEMFIKTGERTMMNYLLRPLMDRSHAAMKEE